MKDLINSRVHGVVEVSEMGKRKNKGMKPKRNKKKGGNMAEPVKIQGKKR